MANTVCSLCCHIVSEHMSNIGFEGGKGGGGQGAAVPTPTKSHNNIMTVVNIL